MAKPIKFVSLNRRNNERVYILRVYYIVSQIFTYFICLLKHNEQGLKF